MLRSELHPLSGALGDAVDASAIEANYSSGVLEATLPKRAQVQPRTIAIVSEQSGRPWATLAAEQPSSDAS